MVGAMGKPDDPRSVLDSAARVYGVSSLRVVDASSSPLLGPGHPMATVCRFFHAVIVNYLLMGILDMIAEKIADSILRDADLAASEEEQGNENSFENVQKHSEL